MTVPCSRKNSSSDENVPLQIQKDTNWHRSFKWNGRAINQWCTLHSWGAYTHQSAVHGRQSVHKQCRGADHKSRCPPGKESSCALSVLRQTTVTLAIHTLGITCLKRCRHGRFNLVPICALLFDRPARLDLRHFACALNVLMMNQRLARLCALLSTHGVVFN